MPLQGKSEFRNRNHQLYFDRHWLFSNYGRNGARHAEVMAENNNPNKWRGRIVRYAPLLLWTAVIFVLSSYHGSMSETSRFIRPILRFLFPSASEELLFFYHGFIRKCAHFAEYAVLAFLSSQAFSNSSTHAWRKYWGLFSLALVFSIAVIDESKQSLDSSRTASVWDVLLDVCGGSAAIFIFFLFKFRTRKKRIAD